MTIHEVIGNEGWRDLAPAAALFHSLSDETRLGMVKRMAGGEIRVGDLAGELGLAQSTVSAHMACLRDCGLVEGRAQGRSVYYSLTRPELMDMLAQAEVLLAATGNAVSLCPNYGAGSTGAGLTKMELTKENTR
ncbi:metalloregulator ArsR/SmtB family transcription factor [Pseudarthrobacter sp. R1]|uniref:ArsR/SmtB family transcription factor n=1 Tax=Pseudarthrobacter sp. R1 TaxID=2944934 RepID=UPI00210AF72E|nr:metalloregulator ArsR/SmtB family transcription factor [Pseudarthrobacter sp. R1]MCQ6271190.1 metalloregulator ArsR/SmtB family transcription factor [Pseudarthrobacter sp. R1]